MSTRAHRAGFTLIELMIVVVIVGILAAIAGPAMYGYMMRARMVDATRSLNDIRRAEASYFAHFSQYCAAGWNPPTAPSGGTQIAWNPNGAPGWNVLGFRADGPQRFSYEVRTGNPGQPDPRGVPVPRDDYWFIVSAVGDLDGDGNQVFVEGYSHGTRVYVGNGLNGPPLAQGWE